jgi:hypothetical protein
MRLCLIAGLTLILAAAGTASAWDANLTCRFEKEICFTIEGERVVHHRELFGPNEVIFAGLDSSTPTIKGDASDTRLIVVRRDSDTVWLMEQPPLGGVNLYTIFRDIGRVIGSKQYRPPTLDVAFLTSIGRCR